MYDDINYIHKVSDNLHIKSCVSQVMHHKLYNLETSYADISYERTASSSGSRHKLGISNMSYKFSINFFPDHNLCFTSYMICSMT